jgi:serine/threonine protein kinase
VHSAGPSRDPASEIDPDETVAPSNAAQSLSHVDLTPTGIPGYCILCEIHRGSQGIVFLAEQESTRDKVALKVMLPGPLADPVRRRRFEREIDVIANLDHPNIAKVFDSGVERGYFYYAMQFIRGTTLTEHVSDQQLSIDDTLRLFQKVCGAVDYAHQRGVIHRDLKPSNILVDQESGEPYVMDFGLAKIAHDSLFQEMNSQRNKFFKATEDLRQDLYAKQLELRSELAKKNSDPERASSLQNDISKLQAKLDQKRIDHMVEMRKINPNTGSRFMGRGGMGYGAGSGGYCWQ